MPRIGKTTSEKFEHMEVKVTLRQRGTRWRADFYVPGTQPARRWVKSYDSREEAKTAAIAVINDAKHGIDLLTAHKMTVTELGRRFLSEHHELEASAESTKHNIDLAFRRLAPIIGHITLENLKRSDVNSAAATFIREGLSVGTIKNYIGALNGALNWAMNQDPPIISYNVATKIALPKKARKRERMYIPSQGTITDVEQLQATLPSDDPLLQVVITDFLLTTGARISECLDVMEIDIHREALTVTLNGKTRTGYRTISISKELLASIDRLSDRWGAHGMVFVRKDGSQNSLGDLVRRRLRHIGQVLKLPTLHPHLFRHYHASRLLADGFGLHYVKERLGHKNIIITSNLYGHLEVGDGRKQLDALDARRRAALAYRLQHPTGPLPETGDIVNAVENLLREEEG